MILYGVLSMKNHFDDISNDKDESFKYIKLASDEGETECIAKYGKKIENEHPNKSIELYRKSYEMNNMMGCAYLGYSLYTSIGNMEKNKEKGIKLIKISYENKNPNGIIYYTNFIQDEAIKYELYFKVSQMGISNLFTLICFCYNNGNVVEKDLNIAMKYYKRAF